MSQNQNENIPYGKKKTNGLSQPTKPKKKQVKKCARYHTN